MSKKLIAGAGVVASFAIALAPLATFADTMQPSDEHTDQLVLTVLPSCTFGSSKKSGSTAQYPGGITHDSYDGGAPEGITATAWDTDGTNADTNGVNHNVPVSGGSAGEVAHNGNDVASTGYGTLPGESGNIAPDAQAEPAIAGNLNASYHTVHRSMLAGTATDTFASTTMWVVCNYRGGYSITATASPLTNGTAGENITVRSDYSATQSGYDLKAITTASGMQLSNGTTFGDANAAAADAVPTSETIIAKKAAVSNEAGDSLTVVYGLGVASSQKADTYAGTVVYKLYKGVNGANNS